MFKDIWSSVVSNWFPATVLFLLLLLALGTFLQRRDLPRLLLGLANILSLFFLSPLLYLRKLITEVSDAERREDKESLSSDQFLIRRQFSALKAGLIIAAVAVLAAGFAAAWTMLPSREDFKQRRENQEFLKQSQLHLASLEMEPAVLEIDWYFKRKTALSKEQLERAEQLDSLRDQRLAIEYSLPAPLHTFIAPLQTFPAKTTPAMPYGGAGNREWEAHQHYIRTRELRNDASATRYFSLWYSENQLAASLREADDIRRRQQPGWGDYGERLQRAQEAIPVLKAQLSQLKERIRTGRTRAIRAFVLTILSFYVLVWLCGLFLEVTGLLIRVAGDIRALRDPLHAFGTRPGPPQPREAPMAAYSLPPSST